MLRLWGKGGGGGEGEGERRGYPRFFHSPDFSPLFLILDRFKIYIPVKLLISMLLSIQPEV